MPDLPQHEEDWEGVDTFVQLVIGAYVAVGEVLNDLQTPIHVPVGEWSAEVAVMAMHDAYAALLGQPISPKLMALCRAMVVEWLTAYEMGPLIALLGDAPWRIVAAMAALARMASCIRAIESELS